MGYTTKEKFIEKLMCSNLCSKEELAFIKQNVETHKELGNDIVLKLGTVNQKERKGILSKFYKVCKSNGFFPKWIYNRKQYRPRIK